MSRHLFVIEGTDGSGKSTQAALTAQALTQAGVDFTRLTFPRYQEESSALLRMYLRGDFGRQPGDVNPYAASTFFAVDRYASFKTGWQRDWEAGKLIFCDRYTTSNAVHQTPKLPPEEREHYLDWLYDLEFDKMGLPRPDLVLYLDMPTEAAAAMRAHREQITGTHADIHERDEDYLRQCRQVGLWTAQRMGWQVICCAQGGAVRSAASIHAEILNYVLPLR